MIKSGYWKTTWHYVKGHWETVTYKSSKYTKVNAGYTKEQLYTAYKARNDVNRPYIRYNSFTGKQGYVLTRRNPDYIPVAHCYFGSRSKKLMGGIAIAGGGFALFGVGAAFSYTGLGGVAMFVGNQGAQEGANQMRDAIEIDKGPWFYK